MSREKRPSFCSAAGEEGCCYYRKFCSDGAVGLPFVLAATDLMHCLSPLTSRLLLFRVPLYEIYRGGCAAKLFLIAVHGKM